MLAIGRTLFLACRIPPALPLSSQSVSKRWMSALTRRKFYKSVSIAGSDGKWEVNLDHRKLKTPGGRLLQIPNKELALGVAFEWDSVNKLIQTSQMHLTGLCFTVLDNPYKRTDRDLAEKITGYLDNDTILFPVVHPSELAETQTREWGAVLEWIRQKFQVELEPAAEGSLAVSVPQETLDVLQNYLSTYNTWALTGLLFAIESVRSTVLPLAALERRLTPGEVVRLSKLEADYQAEMWGRVEWAHDVDSIDTEARVAAGMLVAHLCSYATAHNIRHKIAG